MFDRYQLEEGGKGVNPFISHFRNISKVNQTSERLKDEQLMAYC